MSENLLLVARDFVRRSREHSQAEDFFTEVLAALLRLSPEFREQFLALALGDDSCGSAGPPVWEVTTQEEVEVDGTKYGVPDLILEGAEQADTKPSWIVAVEVKLDAGLRAEQLRRYDTWLRQRVQECDLVCLSALTTSEGAHRAAREASNELEHWSSWIRWAQVEEALTSILEEESSRGEPRVSLPEEELPFRVYGEAFASLLADEGLAPPTPLRPQEDAYLLQEGISAELRSRKINVAHLLHQALRDSGTLSILENRDPSWQPIIARDGLPHRTQHQKHVQLRQRFQPESVRGVFFSFGLVYHAQGWLLRDGQTSRDLKCLDLAAALEIWDETGSKEAGHLSWVLSGENLRVRPVDELCDELNAVFEPESKIFVPEVNYQWAKFVSRRSTQELAGRGKEAQTLVVGKFFRDFVSAFSEISGNALGYPNVSSLTAIERILGSSSL